MRKDDDFRSKEHETVSYIETDIDCTFCLADVKDALVALADVEDVDWSSGCLVVTHHAAIAPVLKLIAERGHRLVEADNGEIVMGSVAAKSVVSCSHRQGTVPLEGKR